MKHRGYKQKLFAFRITGSLVEWMRDHNTEKGFAGDGVEGQPVDFEPGSPEKIEALRARVARGEPTFHRDDRAVTFSTVECYQASEDWRENLE
ncbi:hypothetical protein [Rosistilla oblonga]|uniref:hypothetical protein n=1 Tax=Rosistilla oblonga TaxID=2527990 RepID=UPI003A975DD1